MKRLLNGPSSDCDFIFCAGDDKTDEDMFRCLRKMGYPDDQIFSCTIGSATKKTCAMWHVARSEDLVDVLTKLALTVTQD